MCYVCEQDTESVRVSSHSVFWWQFNCKTLFSRNHSDEVELSDILNVQKTMLNSGDSKHYFSVMCSSDDHALWGFKKRKMFLLFIVCEVT